MRYITAKPFIFVSAAAILALLAAACGGGEESSTQPTFTATSEGIVPLIVSSDLALGPNRFVLGLIDQTKNAEVLGAQLRFRFFALDGDQATLKAESDATPIRLTKTYTHTHADGTVETHQAGETGVYVANVEFDSPGDWGVEISGSIDGQPLAPLTARFTVRERSLSPAIGDPAPRSVQTILSDVADVSEIDTSDPPDPDMHDMTIAEAVTSGKATVIAFATPAFCLSRICGPVKEAVDDLYETYRDQANFVHVEPYFLDLAREGRGLCVVPVFNRQAALEQWGGTGCPTFTKRELPPPEQTWNLQSEPWVFLVDRNGNIAAKFQGVVSYQELESTLLPLLEAAGG